jgi:hypothetical protein
LKKLELMMVETLKDERSLPNYSGHSKKTSKEQGDYVPVNLWVNLRLFRGLNMDLLPLKLTLQRRLLFLVGELWLLSKLRGRVDHRYLLTGRNLGFKPAVGGLSTDF